MIFGKAFVASLQSCVFTLGVRLQLLTDDNMICEDGWSQPGLPAASVSRAAAGRSACGPRTVTHFYERTSVMHDLLPASSTHTNLRFSKLSQKSIKRYDNILLLLLVQICQKCSLHVALCYAICKSFLKYFSDTLFTATMLRQF